MSQQVLEALVTVLLCLSLLVNKQHLLTTLKRVRWLLLVMVCVYIFGTPGQYIDWPFQWLRPTYEGLALGWKQVLKIVAMLTGLSLLLSTTTQKELISGLYQFMSLFSGLGLNAERFTSRLWLTMHYVEQRGDTRIKIHSIKDFFDELSIEPLSENTHKHIELTLLPITLFEKVILIIMLSVILWVVGS